MSHKRLFVGNLELSVSEGELIKLFQNYGTVSTVQYMWHKFGPLKGKPKGFAFVEMSSEQEAAAAMAQLSGKKYKGRQLYISYSTFEEGTDSGAFNRKRPRDGNYGGIDKNNVSAIAENKSMDSKIRGLQFAIMEAAGKRRGSNNSNSETSLKDNASTTYPITSSSLTSRKMHVNTPETSKEGAHSKVSASTLLNGHHINDIASTNTTLKSLETHVANTSSKATSVDDTNNNCSQPLNPVNITKIREGNDLLTADSKEKNYSSDVVEMTARPTTGTSTTHAQKSVDEKIMKLRAALSAKKLANAKS